MFEVSAHNAKVFTGTCYRVTQQWEMSINIGHHRGQIDDELKVIHTKQTMNIQNNITRKGWHYVCSKRAVCVASSAPR